MMSYHWNGPYRKYYTNYRIIQVNDEQIFLYHGIWSTRFLASANEKLTVCNLDQINCMAYREGQLIGV